jgi:hypothetical protein
MKKRYSLSDVDIRKYYLVRKPVRLSDLTYDDLDQSADSFGWQEKARRLQTRRWRKIKHQLA